MVVGSQVKASIHFNYSRFPPGICSYYVFRPVAQSRLNNIIPNDKSNFLYVTLLTYI